MRRGAAGRQKWRCMSLLCAVRALGRLSLILTYFPLTVVLAFVCFYKILPILPAFDRVCFTNQRSLVHWPISNKKQEVRTYNQENVSCSCRAINLCTEPSSTSVISQLSGRGNAHRIVSSCQLWLKLVHKACSILSLELVILEIQGQIRSESLPFFSRPLRTPP